MAARTLTQHLLDVGRDARGAEYAHILSAVAVAVKLTAAMVSRGPLIVDSPAGTASDRQVAIHLRRMASEALLAQTADIRQLAAVSISSSPRVHQVSASGRYLLLFEAMHGTASLADNMPIGSTFSLIERPVSLLGHPLGSGPVVPEDFLQRGSRQLAAGIALFGPRTVLVLTTGSGVDGFTLDRDVGNFVLTHPRMHIPSDARVFTIDASHSSVWPPPVKRYLDEQLAAVTEAGSPFTIRWNASALVGAFRVLNSGGLFLAPRIDGPGGWLAPLLHTAAPLALLAEQAGGAASTGSERVLDLQPSALDSRVSLFLGDAAQVARVEELYSVHEQGYDKEFHHPLFHSRTLFGE